MSVVQAASQLWLTYVCTNILALHLLLIHNIEETLTLTVKLAVTVTRKSVLPKSGPPLPQATVALPVGPNLAARIGPPEDFGLSRMILVPYSDCSRLSKQCLNRKDIATHAIL